jgi:hypothetical protein
MWCAYIIDLEEILKYKKFKRFEKKIVCKMGNT